MEALDDIEAVLLLLFALWLVVTENAKRQSNRRREEAKRKRLEMDREFSEIIKEYEAEDELLRAEKKRRVRVS